MLRELSLAASTLCALGLALGFSYSVPLADEARPSNLPVPFIDADFPPHPMAEVELGRLLFWDKILSGNKNIACATCHHPRFGTSDGLSLGIGEGGIGVGPDRKPDPKDYPEQRIPRNSPALWNVGARGFTVLFDDGRIEVDHSRPSGIRTPLEEEMVHGFASVLSAQTMFPVLANDEMAGHYHENDVSVLVRQGRLTGVGGAWSVIAKRVADIPEYKTQFEAVYPEIAAGRLIAFPDISNAIAAYMTFDFRSDTSPFDAYLRHKGALDASAQQGMELFFGKGKCSTCHSGPLFSDMKFHAMGDPQIGPGKAERFEQHQRDTGRMRVSNDPADAFAFRTPSLRNVTLTAPYGHAGAYKELGEYIKQHIDPGSGLMTYKLTSAALPEMKVGKSDFAPGENGADYAAILKAVNVKSVDLTQQDLENLKSFLKSLEDPVAVSGGRMDIPKTVPSNLNVDQ